MPLMDLCKIASGALQERLEIECRKIIENILDPNTKSTAIREVNIKLKIEPSEDRDSFTLTGYTTSKPAPMKPIETQYLIGRDHKTDEVAVKEFDKGRMRGQMALDDYSERSDDNDAVIDFQKKTE